MGNKDGFRKSGDNQWDELAEAMKSQLNNASFDSEEPSKSEPDLVEGAIGLKKLFDSFKEAGFTGLEAMQLTAEIVARSNNED